MILAITFQEGSVFGSFDFVFLFCMQLDANNDSGSLVGESR